MPFTQETFLGASIRYFSGSVGWGGELTTLTVGLVEDPDNGDVFSPLAAGAPVTFDYQGWIFKGILQSWVKQRSESADPVYEVVIQDPREILNGVQLIINAYNGSVYGVPNLYNIYGQLEANQFGGSLVNESGMPWYLIRNTAVTMISTNPIRLKGYTYFIDLTELPLLPDYYRIGGINVSMMEFIDDVCRAGGSDYFFTLETGRIIKLWTISRNLIPLVGRIQAFINSLSEVNQSAVGEEFRNETTSKFVVGGQVEQVFFNTYNYVAADEDNDYDTPSDYLDENIWPYWGKDINGNAIVGVGRFDETARFDSDGNIIAHAHKFVINVSAANIDAYPDFYATDVDEMRAALNGLDSWKNFLFYMKGKETIHKYKADRLKIGGILNIELITDTITGLPRTPDRLTPSDLVMPTASILENLANADEVKIARLFDFISQYAQEYYGRKFMVRIPFVYVAAEPETDRIRISQEPTDSGFIDQSVWEDALNLRLIPLDVNRLTDDNDKFICYVRYLPGLDIDGEPIILDVSQLNPDDYVYYYGAIYIRCQLEKEIVYLDSSTYFSPRVVITLPHAVYRTRPAFTTWSADTKRMLADSVLSQAEQDAIIKQFGMDSILYADSGPCWIPDLAAIPLRNNLLVYGPWYKSGSQGKVEFEQDETLVPWNYSGFTQMDLVGQAKVSEAATQQTTGETGSVTFAGVPNVGLGGLLIDGGPRVTDINVSIGEDGATTTVHMKTWTPQIGAMAKYNIDRLQRLNTLQTKYRRAMRDLFIYNAKISELVRLSAKNKTTSVPAGLKGRHSTTPLICGEVLGSGDYKMANVTTTPVHNFVYQIKDNYYSKAYNSWDGLFRPFSTDENDEIFPRFEAPTASGINSSTLNPFQSGHDCDILGKVVAESGFPSYVQCVDDEDEKYRLMGLRFPLVGVGWGYDTNGKPVPNENPESPTDNFVADHKKKMNLWKAGPVDIRWDNTKKIWVASGGGTIVKGKLIDNLNPDSSGRMVIISHEGASGDIVWAYDWLLYDWSLYTDTRVFASQIDGFYYVIGAQNPCVVP